MINAREALKKTCERRALIGDQRKAVGEEVIRLLGTEIFPKIQEAIDSGKSSVTTVVNNEGQEAKALSIAMSPGDFEVYVLLHVSTILANDLGFRTEYHQISSSSLDPALSYHQLSVSWSS